MRINHIFMHNYPLLPAAELLIIKFRIFFIKVASKSIFWDTADFIPWSDTEIPCHACKQNTNRWRL